MQTLPCCRGCGDFERTAEQRCLFDSVCRRAYESRDAEVQRLKRELDAMVVLADRHVELCSICIHEDEPGTSTEEGILLGVCHLCQEHKEVVNCFEARGVREEREDG